MPAFVVSQVSEARTGTPGGGVSIQRNDVKPSNNEIVKKSAAKVANGLAQFEI